MQLHASLATNATSSLPTSGPVSAMPQTALERGTQFLGAAMRVAANVSNNPERADYGQLMQGARIAKDAAVLLLNATPRTPFHHLDQAAEHAMEGSKLLQRAALALNAEFPRDETVATVKSLAHRAFGSFDLAFERVEND